MMRIASLCGAGDGGAARRGPRGGGGRALGLLLSGLLLVGLLLRADPVAGQVRELPPADRLPFGQATERDGLPAANVRSLLLDNAGFLWTGTQDGLARYDGRTFRTWRHRRADSTSLPNDIVISLAEDAAGRLWVGTHGGIGRFDAARQRFRTWHHRPADTLGLPGDYDCRVWVARRHGRVWAGTSGGLYRYDPALDDWRRWPLPGMPADRRLIFAGFEDRAGRFWCGNRGQVWVLDGASGRVLASFGIPRRPGEPIIPVNAFYQTASGQVWIATWGSGLVSATDSVGTLLPAPTDHRWNPPRVGVGETDIAFSLTETHDPATRRRTLWVSTDWGLLRLRPPRGGAAWPAHLQAGRDYAAVGAAAPISGDDGAAVLVPPRPLLADPATGRLWAGTPAGLRWHDPRPPLLSAVALPPAPDAAPMCLVPDRDPRTHARQYWYGGWYQVGLQLLDSAFRPVRVWPRLPLNAATERAGQVSGVVRSRLDGAVWVATYDGLVRLDPVSGAVRRFAHVAADSASLPDSRTISLLEDRAGRLWVGTMRGVACFATLADRAVGRCRRTRPIDPVLNLTEDAAGRLWFGTNTTGLWCLPAGPTGPAHQYLPGANPRSLPHAHINALHASPDGRVWVATRAGLGVWQPTTDDFTQYHSGTGLPADNIYAARPDGVGHWWLLTPRGLVRAQFPNGPFRLYTTTNGLPCTDLDGVLAPLPDDGRLALLVGERLLLLDPPAARPSPHRPRVAFTGVELFNRELPLRAPLDSGRHLVFASGEHTLTFHFAALDFAHPAGNRCEYRLTNAAPQPTAAAPWQVSTDGRAAFAHLSGGSYALWVRARNADGRLSARTAVVRFSIGRPWWQTGWFAALVVVAGVAGAVAYRRRVRRQAHERSRRARERAELELRALRAQLNPHFIFNALNAVQELVLTGRATDAGRYLARFARLLRLVLDGADRPTIPLATELEMLELYVAIEQLRLEGLTVVFDIDPDLLAEAPAVPPMVLQPHLENAFWHGVAQRPPAQRRVVVRLTFGPSETTLHAQIDDTGIGRAAAAAAQGPRAHRPRGQDLTARRLRLLGASAANAPDPVRITDLTDPVTGAPLGTRVELWLPLGKELGKE